MEDDVMSLDPANLNESELRPGEDVGMMNNGIKKHEHEIIIIIIWFVMHYLIHGELWRHM